MVGIVLFGAGDNEVTLRVAVQDGLARPHFAPSCARMPFYRVRTGRFDSANQMQLKIETDHGVAEDGKAQISRSETQFTYITTAFKGNQVIMHLRYGPVERTQKSLYSMAWTLRTMKLRPKKSR